MAKKTQSQKAADLLEEYDETCRCESCGRRLGSIDGPDQPKALCESWEHQALWQAHRAEYWLQKSRELNPQHHEHHQTLVEPTEEIA